MSSICAACNVADAQRSALQEQVQVALTRKQLDVLQQQGAAVNELLAGIAAQSKAVDRGTNFAALA